MDQIQNLKTEIESLKADQQKEKHSLRAEIQATADALVQSQAALAESQAENDALKRARDEMESESMPGTPVSSGTPPPTGRGNKRGGFVRSSVHPDISIPLLTPELDKLLNRHSKGRPDRYAIPRMCNRREIPRVDTEYQLGWIPRQMWLTSERSQNISQNI
ncbi:unnamed protein product [Coregonus sp. 'balchen']|nr:unnamed protein product [Coregonus sp. 'balchen']